MAEQDSKLNEMVDEVSLVEEHQTNNGNRGRDRKVSDLLDLFELQNRIAARQSRRSGGSIFKRIVD